MQVGGSLRDRPVVMLAPPEIAVARSARLHVAATPSCALPSGAILREVNTALVTAAAREYDAPGRPHHGGGLRDYVLPLTHWKSAPLVTPKNVLFHMYILDNVLIFYPGHLNICNPSSRKTCCAPASPRLLNEEVPLHDASLALLLRIQCCFRGFFFNLLLLVLPRDGNSESWLTP
jgi:hypothetical protein